MPAGGSRKLVRELQVLFSAFTPVKQRFAFRFRCYVQPQGAALSHSQTRTATARYRLAHHHLQQTDFRPRRTKLTTYDRLRLGINFTSAIPFVPGLSEARRRSIRSYAAHLGECCRPCLLMFPPATPVPFPPSLHKLDWVRCGYRQVFLASILPPDFAALARVSGHTTYLIHVYMP